MNHRIEIDVKRDDGDVTRLVGTAGIAAITKLNPDDPSGEAVNDAPWISLRADTRLQLAHLLAGIIASVRAQDPRVPAAMELSKTMNAAAPEKRRELP